MTTITQQWYALYLHSRCEKKVSFELVGKNVEAFLPLIEEVHKWRDRKKKVLEPLFRGYVFVKTDLRDNGKILATDGVVRFVGINHRPSAIPEAQIDWVRRIIGQPQDIRRERYVEVGNKVRVVAGPLLGVEGYVLRKQGVSRVVISIEAIAQSVSLQVPTEILEAVHPSNKSFLI